MEVVVSRIDLVKQVVEARLDVHDVPNRDLSRPSQAHNLQDQVLSQEDNNDCGEKPPKYEDQHDIHLGGVASFYVEEEGAVAMFRRLVLDALWVVSLNEH